MKIVSWNVNGIRAVLAKGFMDYLTKTSPDILCLQEIKANTDQLDMDILNPRGYYTFWNPGNRPGYAGVASFTKIKPVNAENGFGMKKFDKEGRIIMTEFSNFVLFNVYFPNGQKDEERLKFKLDFYDEFLKVCLDLRRKGKSVIISGDYNTAHKPIDLAHPKANEERSGFLPVERAWIDRLENSGFIDTFRHFCKESNRYSWWSYRMNARNNNVGWRIDYHFVSADLTPCLKNASIHPDVTGSDHCPVAVEIEFP